MQILMVDDIIISILNHKNTIKNLFPHCSKREWEMKGHLKST